ncbi:MAG TPA: caspase family protein [Chitinophagaceae bacterium]|nr:caspase family protein [Chitinophagaceae bacterium]
MNRLVLLLLSYVAVITVATAQPGGRGVITKADTVTAGNTYAIIIGISDYKLVPDLQFAHRDAQAFEDFLVSDAGGKIPKTNIETFLNENATRNNIGDAISVIARKAKPGDRVWFFFAGHGDMEDLTQIENGLLLLYNSPNGNYFGMNDDVLEILDLKRYLSPLSQRGVEMIFIVDACHSGNLNGGVQGVQQTASALASSWGKEYKILSCQPNQLSLEGAEWAGGRGLFSLQLEEAIKGLADTDNDGRITMFELQSYIQANVSRYSEFKQIPMITGDLSRSFFKVNPAILAALKKEKELNYPILAKANTKGMEEKYVDSLSAAGKKLWLSYKANLEAKQLILPKDTNALLDYRQFARLYPDNPLSSIMRRNLAAALNNRFDSIVSPLLRGQTSYSTRNECYYAAIELDSCMHLLGEQHYMYPNLKARALYMSAMSYTWAMSDNEYNISWRPTVEMALELLKSSAEYEPNASYTLLALGIHYSYLYEYEKANKAFAKYLELRPYDLYARYSLAQVYLKMGHYEKAEPIFLQMGDKLSLFDLYLKRNDHQKALAIATDFINDSMTRRDGYFMKGICFVYEDQLDSSVYYYNRCKELSAANRDVCDNNIGHIYFVHGQVDSARKYFQQVISQDSTYTHSLFNLGVIEAAENNPQAAIESFYKAVINASGTLEGFVGNLQLYFGKKYHMVNPGEFEKFRRKIYTFNMQYLSYLGILYTYIRVPGMIEKKDNVDYLFLQLSMYPQHEMLTWYHKACYYAMIKNKTKALESLEKALAMGFGSYFQVSSDMDLDIIRDSPGYTTLLKKYFPVEARKQ